MPETDESRLLDLIVRWEELRDAGQVVTAESLCADCPELLPALQERLNALRAVDGALQTQDTGQLTKSLHPDKNLDTPPHPARESAAGGTVATVPGYEILRELGRGGMGVVYLARQVGVGRLVAIKMLLSGAHAAAVERTRFEAEVAAIGRLQHPNLVQVFEVNEHDGRAYFSMEYLDGGSLEDKIAGKPQPARQAAEVVQTLARAMHAAHQHGVVHRDLKPGNVLLTAGGVPKISDFGLAKRLDIADGPTLTRHVLGTPSYMAPEQAAGRSKTVDARTDVYALGTILYEMLTGRPPFVGDSIMDVLLQVAGEDPLAPRRLSKAVPPDLETVCLKCLQKNPSHRYATAAALADDLGRFLADEPIRARQTSTWRRLMKWVRRRPAAAGLIAVSGLALLTALIAGWWFTHRLASELEWTRQARSDAETARHELKQSLVAQVVEGLADDVRQLEAVPQTMSVLLARRIDWNEGDLAAWMRALLEKDERLFGICVAFEPRQFGGDRRRDDFCLYAHRTPTGVVTKHLLPPEYPPPFYRDRHWYSVPKALGRASWSEPYIEEGAEDTPTVTYSVPIVRDGAFIGVVTADLSMDYFRAFHTDLQNLRLGPNTTSMVVSPGGTFIYHPNPAFEFPAKSSSLERIPASPDFLALVKRMETEDSGRGSATDFDTGRPATFIFARVPSTRWQFVVVDTGAEPAR
jgi:serine/threonine protein kinase